MEYKGYSAKIEVDEDGRSLVGVIADIRDVVTFEGNDFDEIEREFHASVDEYVAYCAERGEEPDKPYSGKLLLRMSPALHKAVALSARASSKSLNQWIIAAAEMAIEAESGDREGAVAANLMGHLNLV